MKKHLITLLAVAAFAVGCKTLNELTKFDLPFKKTVTIPALPVAGTAPDIEIKNIETRIDSVLQSYHLSADRIQNIKLKKMELTLVSPADGDLSFLHSVEIWLLADGMADVKIASYGDLTSNTRVLNLDIENAALKEYILKDKFGIRIKVATDKPTVVEQKIDMSFVFLVDLKILGI
ncbi:MAG TPA: hypothetical protein VK152_06515 [Paludibacter sp.]|nr:hypothetical protein [Paludibacter sp.]